VAELSLCQKANTGGCESLAQLVLFLDGCWLSVAMVSIFERWQWVDSLFGSHGSKPMEVAILAAHERYAGHSDSLWSRVGRAWVIYEW
jgi:hypothetical protein